MDSGLSYGIKCDILSFPLLSDLKIAHPRAMRGEAPLLLIVWWDVCMGRGIPWIPQASSY